MPRYRIDPERSTVTIEASSSVHPIHSEAGGLEGWLDLEVTAEGAVDLASAPTARIEFPVERLRSGNPLEDRELKRRIDAKHFPRIIGEMTRMEEPTDESGAAGAAGDDAADGASTEDASGARYLVTGELTFMGQTRRYAHDIVVSVADDQSVRVQGAAEFDVRDFGMEPPKILMLKVHPEVVVAIDLLAVLD